MTTGTRSAPEVTWAQVHAFRVSRHHLALRAPKAKLAQVVGAIGGVQAQVMSAAELQIAVRVHCSTDDVRTALWTDRTLVKTWLMRGTLHLLPAADLPVFAAALSARFTPPPSWLKFYGMTAREFASFADAIGEVLGAVPITKQEIVARMAMGRSRRVSEQILSGWGGMLKPAARRGLLCFGPSRGTNVTFVRPEKWVRSWRAIDPETALPEVARRYLRAYGPATRSDFKRWFAPSVGGGAALAAWSALEGELVTVSVAGQQVELLESDVAALRRQTSRGSVQLLPAFDPFLMGHATRDHLFDRVHSAKVSRTAGWISQVILVEGRVAGTWSHTVAGDTLHITLAPFAALPRAMRTEVRARAETIAEAMSLARVDLR